jgi:hypothetical protein
MGSNNNEIVIEHRVIVDIRIPLLFRHDDNPSSFSLDIRASKSSYLTLAGSIISN